MKKDENQNLSGEDKRILDLRLRKHEISHAEHQKALKSLPDDQENADELVVYKDQVASS